ncbi:MAG: hypothetical protein NZ908_02825 [Candidatus Micrarchaeota archaeon]|nr:hypothetical protein [Candidatus Micrarchaeota archaeon]
MTLDHTIEQSILTSNIIVDYRENLLIEFLKPRMNIVISNLPVDVVIGNIAIERKTIDDFESSIIDGRLFEQIRILKQYQNPVIAIETGMPSRIHVNSYYGTLAKLVKERISVMRYSNIEELGGIITFLARDNQSESKIVWKKDVDDPVRSVIQSLPGVGTKRTEMIMREYTSLREFFNSDIERLQRVLGKGLGERIYRIINQKYK